MRPASTDGLEPPDGHPFEDLVALVDGRLGLEKLRRVVIHARTCRECQAELVEIAAGAGALRLAGQEDLVAPSELPAPDFLRLIEAEAPVEETVPDTGPPNVSVRPASKRRRLTAVVATVAAAVLAGAIAVAVTHKSPKSPATQIAFAAIDRSGGHGLVQMQSAGRDKAMTVSTVLAPPTGGSYYEVWLLQRHTGAMVPVGVLPQTGQARYVIPAVLVAHYDAVDISLQPDNGSTVHSADSVLRAYYSA